MIKEKEEASRTSTLTIKIINKLMEEDTEGNLELTLILKIPMTTYIVKILAANKKTPT